MNEKIKEHAIAATLWVLLVIAVSAVLIWVATDVAHTQHCQNQTYQLYSECMED